MNLLALDALLEDLARLVQGQRRATFGHEDRNRKMRERLGLDVEKLKRTSRVDKRRMKRHEGQRRERAKKERERRTQ